MFDPGHATDHGVGADPHELVHRRQAADDRKITHHDMPSQGGVVGEDNIVSDDAIMGNMRADHEKAFSPDLRQQTAAVRTRVHGDMFANAAPLTDDEFRFFAGIFKVLRREADRGEGIDLGPRSNTCLAADNNMAAQAHAVPQHDFPAHHGVRADLYVIADFRAIFDDRSRVNR